MGMDPATLALIIPAIASVGGKVGEGLLAPQPQHFTSFAGGPNDPTKLLSQAGGNLSDVFSAILPKMLSAPDMSDAYVQDLPSRRSPDNLPIDLSGPHATWGGGDNGPKRLPPPTNAPATIPTHEASPATPDAPLPWSDISTQLAKTMNPRNIPSGPQRVTYTPGDSGPIADALRSIDGGAWTSNVGANAPADGMIHPRTKGAAQMLLHLAQPSVMAQAGAQA